MPRYIHAKEIELLVNDYLENYSSDPSKWVDPNPWDEITTDNWHTAIVPLFRAACRTIHFNDIRQDSSFDEAMR